MKLRQAFFPIFLLVSLFIVSSALAQAPRGTLVHEGTLHIAPDAQSAKLNEVARGHELIILETSRDWTHVQAIISEPRKDRDEDDDQCDDLPDRQRRAEALEVSENLFGIH